MIQYILKEYVAMLADERFENVDFMVIKGLYHIRVN